MTTRDNTRVTHRAPRRGPLQAGTLAFAWLLTAALRGALAAIVVLAVLGLPLAIAGRFHRALLPALVLVGVAVLVLWQRLGGARLPAHWASVVVLVVALGTAWVNVTHAAQHLLVDRDPGVYVVTAQHLATEGGLLFPARQGPFGEFPALRYAGAGFQGGRQLFPHFFHLLPVLMAVGGWLGGANWLLATNALLGGASVVAVYAFASRLMRPAWALGSAAALSVNLAQVYFARDAYSEILAQLLLFGGLWALWEAEASRSSVPALLAGLLIGATPAVRIDSFLYLIALMAYLWAHHLSTGRIRYPMAVAAGAALTTAIALVDGLTRSSGYVRDLWPQLRLLLLALAAVAALGVPFALLRPQLRRLQIRYGSWWRYLHLLLSLAIVAAAAFAYWLRPMLATPPGAGASPAEAREYYFTFSLRWLSWYVGMVALVASLAGLVWLLRRFLADPGGQRRLLPFLGSLLLATGLYLWRPRIGSDHIWAMRRFLPAVIPGLLVLAFLFTDRLWRWSPALRPVSLVAAVALVAFPLTTVLPLRAVQAQAGVLPVVQRVCDQVGEDGAVVVMRGSFLQLTIPQSLQAFCGFPVAVERANQELAPHLPELASRWREQGRQLYLLAPGVPPPFPGLATQVVLSERVPIRGLERVQNERPDEVVPLVPPAPRGGGALQLYLLRVSPATD